LLPGQTGLRNDCDFNALSI